MAFELFIEVFGNGDDPNHRSHWGFLVARQGDDFGDLYHVLLIDQSKLWYQLDVRRGTTIKTRQAEGVCKIPLQDGALLSKTIKIIESEPAPQDGKRKCQDWTVDVLISLEAEEIVEAGTAEKWGNRVGMNAKDLAKDCGGDWESF